MYHKPGSSAQRQDLQRFAEKNTSGAPCLAARECVDFATQTTNVWPRAGTVTYSAREPSAQIEICKARAPAASQCRPGHRGLAAGCSCLLLDALLLVLLPHNVQRRVSLALQHRRLAHFSHSRAPLHYGAQTLRRATRASEVKQGAWGRSPCAHNLVSGAAEPACQHLPAACILGTAGRPQSRCIAATRPACADDAPCAMTTSHLAFDRLMQAARAQRRRRIAPVTTTNTSQRDGALNATQRYKGGCLLGCCTCHCCMAYTTREQRPRWGTNVRTRLERCGSVTMGPAAAGRPGAALPGAVQNCEASHPCAHLPVQRERGERAVVHALLVELPDVDLDGRVVLGGDNLVRPGTARHRKRSVAALALATLRLLLHQSAPA